MLNLISLLIFQKGHLTKHMHNSLFHPQNIKKLPMEHSPIICVAQITVVGYEKTKPNTNSGGDPRLQR